MVLSAPRLEPGTGLSCPSTLYSNECLQFKLWTWVYSWCHSPLMAKGSLVDTKVYIIHVAAGESALNERSAVECLSFRGYLLAPQSTDRRKEMQSCESKSSSLLGASISIQWSKFRPSFSKTGCRDACRLL